MFPNSYHCGQTHLQSDCVKINLAVILLTYKSHMLSLCWHWLTAGDTKDYGRPDIQLEFKCFLVDNKTGHHIPVSTSVHLCVYSRMLSYIPVQATTLYSLFSNTANLIVTGNKNAIVQFCSYICINKTCN